MTGQPNQAPASSAEPLSIEHVRKIARLAMLDPSPDQLERARENISAVLGYMRRLDDALARGSSSEQTAIQPGAEPDRLVNALRDDVPGPTLDRAAFLAIAPDTGGEGGVYLRIPSPPGQGDEGGA